MARVFGAAIALALSIFLGALPSAAQVVPLAEAAAYTYDAPAYDSPGNDSIQERGPPGVAVANTA